MRHLRRRTWWKPWLIRCSCGDRWPHAEPVATPIPDFTPSTWAIHRMRNPGWVEPITELPPVRPLMTRGQAWRADAGSRRARGNAGRWPPLNQR